MKSRPSLLAALGVLLVGSALMAACTSPDRLFGPGTGATTSGAGGASSSSGATMSVGTGTISTVPCSVPSDCSGKETECQTRTCTGGFCGVAFTDAGVGIKVQNGGDCQKIVCDGLGALTQQVDDTDVPNDSNPCSQDVCTMGVPSNPPVAFGNTCGGTLTCDNQGNCTGCISPGDCPGADTDCQTRSCTAGVCGFLYAASGTMVQMQTAFDCKQNVCNGHGAVSLTFDPSDPQDDGNECTLDGCSNGSPIHSNLAAGAPCFNKTAPVCNGTGACVACLIAATCPGQDDECQTRACNAGTCGYTYVPTGTMVQVQSAGDCKKNVCNGSGAVTQIADDSDVQQDGNACTSDACSKGTVVHTPVAQGTDCGAPKTCDAGGNCAGCFSVKDYAGQDSECQTRTCTGGVCGFSFTPNGTPVAAQASGDCKKNVCDGAGNVAVVLDQGDVAADGNECTADSCSGGAPSYPPAPVNTPCSVGGTVCNGVGGCGVCSPGDSKFCCGLKSTACCFATPVVDPTSPGAIQSDIASDSLLPCCCGGTIDCDSTGQWGACQG